MNVFFYSYFTSRFWLLVKELFSLKTEPIFIFWLDSKPDRILSISLDSYILTQLWNGPMFSFWENFIQDQCFDSTLNRTNVYLLTNVWNEPVFTFFTQLYTGQIFMYRVNSNPDQCLLFDSNLNRACVYPFYSSKPDQLLSIRSTLNRTRFYPFI